MHGRKGEELIPQHPVDCVTVSANANLEVGASPLAT